MLLVPLRGVVEVDGKGGTYGRISDSHLFFLLSCFSQSLCQYTLPFTHPIRIVESVGLLSGHESPLFAS